MNKLHHIAIKTNKAEWYVKFFKKVFSMNVKKEVSNSEARKIWFYEGIQINEVTENCNQEGYTDHIAISTEEKEAIIRKSGECGCVQIKENWIQLPDGLIIELIEM